MDMSIPEMIQNLINVAAAAKVDWGSIHPLVIHLPLVLLLLVPVFYIAGLLFSKPRTTLFVSALLLLWAGTLAIYLCISTGDGASEAVAKSGETFKILRLHDELAETSRNVFSGIAIYFTLYLLTLALLKSKVKPILNFFLSIVFLLSYGFGLLILLNTAHQGGRLVHQQGVKSSLYSHTEKK